MKKFSFLLLTWNRASMLSICLDSLINSIDDKKNSEIIIFDNASNDETSNILNKFKNTYDSDIDIKIIYSQRNIKLAAYKELYRMAQGEIIIELDDDVLIFPNKVDMIFEKYLKKFNKFGFIALDVIQNEYTNGAKPEEHFYKEVIIDNLILQQGPTGGWCSAIRRKDFKFISWIFNILPLSMSLGEDLALQRLMKLLGKKSGIIKNIKCLHASGPYYSKHYGLLERDIEKYRVSNLGALVDVYKNYDNK